MKVALSTERKARISADLYRKAALRVEKGITSCSCDAASAIYHGCYGSTPASQRYAEVFKPFKRDPRDAEIWGEKWGKDGDEIQNCRILALCFMAAMVEAGDA